MEINVMEKKNPKVSVIMQCYNHEKYVVEAIESVLAQTYRDYEFIIGNNGSTDGCGEIIERYKGCVQIITLEKNNPSKCGKMLMDAAQGEFIAFIASDDYWYPNKLEEQVRATEQYPECNIFFAWTEMTGENLSEITDRKQFAQNNRSRYQWIRDLMIGGTLTDISSILIRNDGRYQKYMRDTHRFMKIPDLRLYLSMVLEEDIYVVEKFLVKHRMHGENVSAPGADTYIRAVNERGYIIYEIWRQLTDEDFCKAFLGEEYKAGTKEDIMCQRILQYMKLVKDMPGGGNNALAYAWDHYYDKGVSELLEEKYGFTLQDLYQYEFEVGEGKYWYQLLQKKIIEDRKNNLSQIISCNNKVISYAENKSIRGELQKLVRVALENIQKIGVNDVLLQACIEKQMLMEQSGMEDDLWYDFIYKLDELNEKLKNEYGLT